MRRQRLHQHIRTASSASRSTFGPRSLTFALLLVLLPRLLPAQQPSALTAEPGSLPEAPGRTSGHPFAGPTPLAQTFATQTPPTQPSTASISGIVLDINAGLVADARVALIPAGGANNNGTEQRVITSTSDGSFTFVNLPAGTYKVRITSPGLETFLSSSVALRANERYQLPHIALPIATASSDVTVTVTEHEIAQEQVEIQLQQRVLGVFPNFYTSFIWNAAPLSARQKFHLALRSTTDPVSFFTAGIIAGAEQYNGTYSGYGDGAEGFAKRYGATYGDNFVGRMIGGAILASVLHQDPRYFYRGSGSIKSRALYAISAAVICKGDNGRWQPNYSHVLGNFAAGGISNLYRPDADRGAMLAVDNALIHTAGTAGANLIREFVLRGFTSKVPAYAKGKEEQPRKNTPRSMP